MEEDNWMSASNSCPNPRWPMPHYYASGKLDILGNRKSYYKGLSCPSASIGHPGEVGWVDSFI